MSRPAFPPSPELQRLLQAFHHHRGECPNTCVQLGIDRNLDRLPDPSLQHAAAHGRAAASLQKRFEQLDVSVLGFDDALDVELAQLLLGAEAFDAEYTFNDQRTAPQSPRAGDDIGEGLFMLAVADPRPAAERLADITARVEGIEAYTQAALARLTRPVARWARMDAEKVSELPTLLESLHAWARQEGFADADRLGRARERGEAALRAYRQGLLALPTTDQLHVGVETAERIIALRGIEKGLSELHDMARRFLAETGEQLELLRQRLARKYRLGAEASLRDVHDELNRRFQVPRHGEGFEYLIERYRREQADILSFVRARDLFPIPSDQELKILATPGFMVPSIPAGAMSSPAPFRPGIKTSLIFLTLSEALLNEHTELTIPVMMVHEGIPGHHLQLATASQHPSVVRRHLLANEHAEGWTTMLEDYLLDQGYCAELVDEVRFCAKRDLCRIGARVAIDLFFMTGERDHLHVGVPLGESAQSPDPFAPAAELLQAVTGFTPGRTQAELNWYSQERGYPLSYLTGNQLVADLRRDLASAQPAKGAGELDRLFFDRYLELGNMPLSFLRRCLVHEGLLPAAAP